MGKILSGKQFRFKKNFRMGAFVMATRFFIESIADCDLIMIYGVNFKVLFCSRFYNKMKLFGFFF